MATTWFITGSSSGFGRLLTERLLARGDRVAATARRPEALDDLRRPAGDRLWTAPLDVTDAGQARQVMTGAFTALGPIDVIVSNAGYSVLASVEEASDEQIRRVIDTNLLGSVNVIRAALPHLRAQGRARPAGLGGRRPGRLPVLRLLHRGQVGRCRCAARSGPTPTTTCTRR